MDPQNPSAYAISARMATAVAIPLRQTLHTRQHSMATAPSALVIGASGGLGSALTEALRATRATALIW